MPYIVNNQRWDEKHCKVNNKWIDCYKKDGNYYKRDEDYYNINEVLKT